jgi:hypothetical protein
MILKGFPGQASETVLNKEFQEPLTVPAGSSGLFFRVQNSPATLDVQSLDSTGDFNAAGMPIRDFAQRFVSRLVAAAEGNSGAMLIPGTIG